MPRMTITEVAAHVGVHKSTVSRQVRRAGLVGADGKLDLDQYQQLRDTALDPAHQTTGRDAPRLLPVSDESGLAAERLRKMAADAELAEIAVRRQRGELLDRGAVASVLGPLLRRLRDDLVALPRDIILDPVQAQECEDAIAAKLEVVSMEIMNHGAPSPAA